MELGNDGHKWRKNGSNLQLSPIADRLRSGSDHPTIQFLSM